MHLKKKDSGHETRVMSFLEFVNQILDGKIFFKSVKTTTLSNINKGD